MISIILVEPQMGENIGAAARAMKNFGISDLRIINPRDGWPNPQAIAMSVGAVDIINSAVIYDNLRDAIADLHKIYATSCQTRDMNKSVLNSSELQQHILDLFGNSTTSTKIGFVFGRESSGLGNEEIMLADEIVSIPTTKFSSLNLGQAICIICYELFKNSTNTISTAQSNKIDDLATKQDKEYFYQHLFDALQSKDFFKTETKSKIMQMKIRNIFERINNLTSTELRTLRGIIANLIK